MEFEGLVEDGGRGHTNTNAQSTTPCQYSDTKNNMQYKLAQARREQARQQWRDGLELICWILLDTLQQDCNIHIQHNHAFQALYSLPHLQRMAEPCALQRCRERVVERVHLGADEGKIGHGWGDH